MQGINYDYVLLNNKFVLDTPMKNTLQIGNREHTHIYLHVNKKNNCFEKWKAESN